MQSNRTQRIKDKYYSTTQDRTGSARKDNLFSPKSSSPIKSFRKAVTTYQRKKGVDEEGYSSNRPGTASKQDLTADMSQSGGNRRKTRDLFKEFLGKSQDEGVADKGPTKTLEELMDQTSEQPYKMKVSPQQPNTL